MPFARALLNVVQYGLILIWTAFLATLALAARALGSRRMPLALASRLWAPGVLRLTGARLAASGVERLAGAGAVVLVVNHQSMMDIPALFAALPGDLFFVGKAELRRMPFVGWYMAAVGMAFVDRAAGGQAAEVFSQVIATLRGGGRVVFFPEGTRSPDGAVRPFRRGAFAAAALAAVPVVPVGISGARDVLGARGWRIRPGRIEVRVGEPITTAGEPPVEVAALAERARRAVRLLAAPPAAAAFSSPAGASPG